MRIHGLLLGAIDFEWGINEGFRVRWLRRVEKVLLSDLIVRRTLPIELFQTVVISFLMPGRLGCLSHGLWLGFHLVYV